MTLPDATVWVPLLAAFGGFILKGLFDLVQHFYQANRERTGRKELRLEKLSDQRRAFQRETLLALQESVMDLMRTIGAAYSQDEMAFRQTGQWKKQLLSEELNEQDFVAMRRTGMLHVRVRDDSLRELVRAFREYASQTTCSTTLDANRAALGKTSDTFEKIQERIGELLRTLDDEERQVLS